MTNSKKILIITGDGGESYETLYAKHRMAEAGHHAVIASTSRKRIHLVIHDFEPGWDTYVERQGYWMESDLGFDEVDSDEYDALLIPGGRSPEYLRNHPKVIAIVREFYESGKFIFAICHGIQILVTAGLVDKRRITCYEHVRFEVESCGGVYVADRQAVRDGKLITGQTWQSHPEFYREVFACLNE
ncbi:MAG: DJ-1/PfpI family protein [Microscillaceae bacterium]|nr:DJ-1/PfpI family protein [Microscillaceae bacterium]